MEDRRISKTKENIKMAFFSLLSEKDYSKISITELTEKANIGRKTFYLHYGSIDDIVKEIEDMFQKQVNVHIAKYIVDSSYDLNNVFDDILLVVRDKYDFFQMVANRDSYLIFQASCKNILKSQIQSILKARYCLEDNVVSLCSEFYASAIIGIYISWIKSPNELSLEDVTKLIKKLCMDGSRNLIKK